ncbi:MAG: T9SS type A sorting domain-containing protein, partial [Bacteroidales bacterium]|nr:T9SS type A sorting domain-containing protein [Candidatus Colimorpha onthohippi]
EQDRVLLNATAEFLSADAGDNKRVDVTYQFDATCAVCGNYDLPDPDVLYADIVPLRLTIAGTRIEDTKVYDATTDAWVEPGDLENVILGDIVNVDASAAYVDKNVGESKPVVVTYRISGSAAANYLAPIDDTLPADITPFQLLSEYFAVDQSKVYDQSDSAHVILGTVNSYLGDDIYAEAVATYLTNQVGNNIPVILVFSLSGADKDNYYAPINDTQYASITRRQLTAEGIVRVDTVRMYDGTNIAQITSHATMQGVLPGDQVFMFDSALYNDANPGINKTINVYYYIYGRDAGNYTAPIEFFYCNTAKILQSIVIDSTNSQQGIAFEVSSNGYCQSQTDGAIGYKISQGEACEFKLDFGASATGVGFQSIPWTALPNELQGEITLVIPDDCPAGQYDAIITFRNEIGVESTPTVVTFVVNLPKDYIVQIFNDVVSIDKHKIQGDSYQWYHNGERIPGATLPYYQQEGGLTGNYYVAVNLNTRSTVRTCDQSNWIKMVEQQKIVSVYPNPVVTAARVVLSNFEEEGHHISLTNAQGVRVYQSVFTGDETVLNFDLYNSGTYYLSVDGITAKVVKP